MSFIASFYLIPDSQRQNLVQAAVEQDQALRKRRWGIFRPKLPLQHDPLWSFLEKNATSCPDFPYSGFVLVDLWTLEPSITESDDLVGTELSRITRNYWASYRQTEARHCLENLHPSLWHDSRLSPIAADSGLTVPQLQDALSLYRHWLESVKEGFTGILSNG